MRKPIIPMSADQLPEQRIVPVPHLPERPEPFDATVGWGVKPQGLKLSNGPSNAEYLGQLEWAWSSINGRIKAYYLSRGRTHWILWTRCFDDNWSRWQWLAIGHVPRRQASEMQAAIHLLADFWRMERDTTELDHFHWINEEGLLDAGEWRTIGRLVWPTHAAEGEGQDD